MNLRRLAGALLLAACAREPEARPAQPTVLFLTDFGVVDGAVGLCKAVMWDIAPSARIVDLTHQIPAYDVETAGEVLEQAVPYYPAGTVVVAVVDPGVGGARKSIAVRTRKGHLLVGPDNGIFSLLIATEGLDRAVEISNTRYHRQGVTSHTFHGRDIFSPVGAHLAAGVPLDSLGPAVTPFALDVRAPSRTGAQITGTVRYVEDPYGNVVSNIPGSWIDSIGARVGDTLRVSFGSRTMRLPWQKTFSDVAIGSPLVVIHERDLVSFSINQGNFATSFGIARRTPVVIERVTPSP